MVVSAVSSSSHLAKAVAGAGVLLAGCSPGPAPSPSSPPASTQAATPGGPALRAGPLGALTAHGVVQALTQAGLPVVNPVDTTAKDCAAAGCQQAVVTDQFRVESFATTGQAQRYGAEHKMLQVQSVVMEFASNLPEAQRQRYWAEVVRQMT